MSVWRVVILNSRNTSVPNAAAEEQLADARLHFSTRSLTHEALISAQGIMNITMLAFRREVVVLASEVRISYTVWTQQGSKHLVFV